MKKEGNVHKKRRFYSVLEKKEGWKKKEGKKKEMYPPQQKWHPEDQKWHPEVHNFIF